MKRILSVVLLSGYASFFSFAGEKDVSYVTPRPTEELHLDEDSSMKKMETAVSPEVWAAYRKENPAPFWLFGEDRRLAVRNRTIPAHWFSSEAAHRSFQGVAQPGEFYPFQCCVASETERELIWRPQSDGKLDILCITPSSCRVQANGVKPLWLMVKVPPHSKQGEKLSGVIEVKDAKTGESQNLPFSIMVRGEVLRDGGIQDSWRLARLSWLEGDFGTGDSPTRFFTPLRVDRGRRAIHLIGRTLELGKGGLPAQYISTYNGSNTRIDAAPQRFFEKPVEFSLNGTSSAWVEEDFSFGKTTATEVTWRAHARLGQIRRTVEGSIGFDGYAAIQIRLESPDKPCRISRAELTFTTQKGRGEYGMGLGKRGGNIPEQLDWKWDVKKQQDAYWFGSVNQGMMFRLKGGNFSRALINGYYAFKPLNLPDSWGNGGVQMTCREGAAAFRLYSAEHTISRKPLVYGLDLYLTPFHPLHLREHLTDRYRHLGQRHGNALVKETRQGGATVLNLHHNTLWNPYINYPYNDDGGPFLKQVVKEAHAEDLRIKVYYTTREITQNMPEFFALKSLDGEIFMKRKEGVPWPYHNRKGPHPWLQKHVGMDIIPAWRETVRFKEYPNQLDLAVITTPDTRWNNFYLGGLEHLVKAYGIDGIYIDDTMLNRETLLRGRRILDADGRTDRRIDFHSWNHYHPVAGYGSSAIVFLEIFPFLDRLWFGESFDYINVTPDFWLVEMSGIPFGLLGEMLGRKTNSYRGMLYAQTNRWGGGHHPPTLWKFFNAVDLVQAEMIGYWDPRNPVRVPAGSPIRATVYRCKGKTVIAFANFSNQEATAAVEFRTAELNLPEGATALSKPAIDQFQEAGSQSLLKPVTLPGGGGCILIAE